MPKVIKDYETVHKMYYSIKEVSKILNLRQNQVRHFCDEYYLQPHRNARGERKFSNSELDTLKLIVRLNVFMRPGGIRRALVGGKAYGFEKLWYGEDKEPIVKAL